jgi:hypothetical protein
VRDGYGRLRPNGFGECVGNVAEILGVFEPSGFSRIRKKRNFHQTRSRSSIMTRWQQNSEIRFADSAICDRRD